MLLCATPERWLALVNGHIDTLLVDHANCEKKAASAALAMLYRYPEHPDLLLAMSRLARQELRHFEQVLRWLAKAGIPYRSLSASRYAAQLHEQIRGEPYRLLDALVVGALVEARSCERFRALQPVLGDPALATFYGRLAESEAHHQDVYADLGRGLAGGGFDERLAQLAVVEADLICSADPVFRFHSGTPASG